MQQNSNFNFKKITFHLFKSYIVLNILLSNMSNNYLVNSVVFEEALQQQLNNAVTIFVNTEMVINCLFNYYSIFTQTEMNF